MRYLFFTSLLFFTVSGWSQANKLDSNLIVPATGTNSAVPGNTIRVAPNVNTTVIPSTEATNNSNTNPRTATVIRFGRSKHADKPVSADSITLQKADTTLRSGGTAIPKKQKH